LNLVKFAFDPAKDAINREKHGVTLALAEALFDGPHHVVDDDRFDYGEKRRFAFGRVVGRLFVCVFVDRGETRRIISLRRANSRETRRHGQQT
jgi:uncharacterized DUF497 family protein